MNPNLRHEALRIWQAGVQAVRSDVLVSQAIQATPHHLRIGPVTFSRGELGRIEVVGAGKAGAGMARGLLKALGDDWIKQTQLRGWINVPDDCVEPLESIHLHGARPAGKNIPTTEGVRGAREILERVSRLTPRDVCVCLISGGGSALLPAPPDDLPLEDLLRVTQQLSAAGATIQELNAVRKRLSLIQGGKLAAACRAGTLVTLIISDVLGDPLDVIASGPTVMEGDERQAAREALRVFDHYQLARQGVSAAARQILENAAASARAVQTTAHVVNHVIGNNAAAVAAAAEEARSLGYQVQVGAPQSAAHVTAEAVGVDLVEQLERLSRTSQPVCLVSGGEPVVRLTARPGKGGRNQQVVLAGLCHALVTQKRPLHRQVILSGGTDGEDGPTDAAGAVADETLVELMRSQSIDPQAALAANDAYSFFSPLDGLIRTGPTHTNVCDVRVAIAR